MEVLTGAEVDTALQNGEVELFLQPIVDVETGSCSHFECLARWQSVEHGLVSVGEYLAAQPSWQAQQDFFDYTLKRLLAQSDQLLESGLPEQLNLNVSLGVLLTHGYKHILSLLAEAPQYGQRLTLEITEQTDHPLTVTALQGLNELRRKGVRLVLDDYGVDYSNERRELNLPFDAIKIDKSILWSPLSVIEQAKWRLKIHAWRQKGCEVIAEGVENYPQWQLARSLGFSHAQGFLIAAALPRSELAAWHRRWKTVSIALTDLNNGLEPSMAPEPAESPYWNALQCGKA